MFEIQQKVQFKHGANWIYLMLSFDEAAKPIRERIKKLSTVTLFTELIQYLRQTYEIKGTGQIAAPWVVLLAIDWVLELHPYSGKRVATKADVKYILDNIWNTQHIAIGTESAPINVQIRALLAPQIIFQKSSLRMVYFFLRMKKIIDSNPEQGAKFKAKFSDKYLIDFEVFYEIAFTMCVFSMNEKISYFTFSVLVNTLVPSYSLKNLSITLNILSSPLSDLINKSIKEKDRLIPEHEYFRQSVFLDSPFLLMIDGLFVIHPDVVMIGISETLIRNFIKLNDGNRVLFSKCFEEYINEIHQEFNVTAIREDKLKDFYRNHAQDNKKVVDFLVLEDQANVYIDAKGIDPTNTVLAATTRHTISQRIKGQHVNAIKQMIETIDVLSEFEFKGIVDIDRRFGLVITHQDFFLGTGEGILSFLSDKLSAELQELANGKLHFNNIHFLTLEQYETLNCIISETDVKLSDFLAYVSECLSDPKKSKAIMDMYIEEFSCKAYGKDFVPLASPSLIKEKDRMFELSLSILQENKDRWEKIGSYGDQGVLRFIRCCKALQNQTIGIDLT